MLNGIGGRTIKEAKQRLSYQEFLAWAEYRRRYGCLNTGAVAASFIGRLTYMVHAGLGGKGKPSEFMPDFRNFDEIQDEIRRANKG